MTEDKNKPVSGDPKPANVAAVVAALGPKKEGIAQHVVIKKAPVVQAAKPTPAPSVKKVEPPKPEPVCIIAPTAAKKSAVAVDPNATRFARVPTIASPEGKRMARMIDEYYSLCAVARKEDIVSITKCTRKLYDIMNMCVPHSVQKNTGAFSELINLLFKALADKRSTLFHDKEIWRASYNLPTPEDCFKFDTFYTVMTQLVDYAKDPSKKPSYNANAIGNVLKSPACFKVLTDLRARLDAR